MSLSTISTISSYYKFMKVASGGGTITLTATLIYDAQTTTDPNVESIGMDTAGNIYVTCQNNNQLVKINTQLQTSFYTVTHPSGGKHRRIFIDSSNRFVCNDTSTMYIIPNIVSPTASTQLRVSGNSSPVLLITPLDFLYYNGGAIIKAAINPTTYALSTSTTTLASGLNNPNILFQMATQPSTGNIYFTDRNVNMVKRYIFGSNTVETVLTVGAQPIGVCFDPFGFLYVSENTSGKILRIDPATGISSTIATITSPLQMYVNKQFILFVTSMSRYVYTLDLNQLYTPGSLFSLFTTSTKYILSSASSKLQMGSSNFTYEFWMRPENTPNIQGLYGHGGNVTDACRCFYSFPGYTNKITVQMYGKSIYATSTFTLSTWNHVAVIKDGDSFKLYINGVLEASTTGVSAYNNLSNQIALFRPYTTLDQEYFCGYIANFRVSNIARYTETFIPSKSNYINDANTILLLNTASFTNYLLDDSTNPVTFTNTNNITYSGVKPN